MKLFRGRIFAYKSSQPESDATLPRAMDHLTVVRIGVIEVACQGGTRPADGSSTRLPCVPK